MLSSAYLACEPPATCKPLITP
ncbi:hypothetical protein YPPY91_2597, partial [Yersinia pestis PY-91]